MPMKKNQETKIVRKRRELMIKEEETRTVLDQFHDSSRVVLLICLNLHSVLKAEKVCQKLRNML
jgi:hypothetical protein